MTNALECDRAFTETDTCAWLGGRCMRASAHDCTELWDQPDYYGESLGFESACGDSPDAVCPGYATALRTYTEKHEATRKMNAQLQNHPHGAWVSSLPWQQQARSLLREEGPVAAFLTIQG